MSMQVTDVAISTTHQILLELIRSHTNPSIRDDEPTPFAVLILHGLDSYVERSSAVPYLFVYEISALQSRRSQVRGESPVRAVKRIFSIASLALEMSSRKKTSRCEYKLLMTMFLSLDTSD
jgi:hypothetical protein